MEVFKKIFKTQADYEAKAKAAFEDADEDKDGFLSRKEWEHYTGHLAISGVFNTGYMRDFIHGASFKTMDDDKDGKISYYDFWNVCCN